jgi:cbb3-type cytochrome c oxidase subunit III
VGKRARVRWTTLLLGSLIVAGGLGWKFDATTVSAAGAPDGRAIFTTRCAACHQANGQGAGPFPPLDGNPDVTATDTSAIIATVLNGKTGPITINGKQYSGAMPAWKGVLSNAEIAAVLSYVRSAWTNKAPPISEEQVALAANPVMLPGKAIFADKCARCHQPNGQGAAQYPPLAGNPAVTATDPSTIVGIIVNGRSGPLTVNGKAYNGTMPAWKGRLSNPDIAAVATYIRSAWGNNASGVTEQEVAAAGTSVSIAVGKSIFDQKCATCHRANGAGGGPFPALAGNANVNAADPSKIISTIKDGRGVMPSWKGQLSNADIAAVVSYIRTAWGNHGSPVTESRVAAIK